MADSFPRAFVCGHPIAHSRSPLIHGHWLRAYGISGTYEAIDVAPSAFAHFLQSVAQNGFAGGNVTIPHKEAAFASVERLDDAASQIGAVNTLWFEDGTLWGGNTDSEGFAANLDARAPGWQRADVAVVLGAGGAARAVIHALAGRGIKDIRVLNRTLSRAAELADRFGAGVTAHPLDGARDAVRDAALVVNTTALGMHHDAGLPMDPDLLPDDTIVTDIVYVPLETPFLAAARRRGLKTVDGLGMLLHQAAPGFERWFGRRPEVTEELRDIIIADVAAKA